jgi:hypothetical protein
MIRAAYRLSDEWSQSMSDRHFHQTRAELLLQLALIWRNKQERRGFAELAGLHLDQAREDAGNDLDRVASPPLAPA